MACGTPLVVNNATANPEIPGPCGEIVDTNNHADVVMAIRKIQAKGRSSYSEQCIKRARNLFDKDKNVQQYIALFEHMRDVVSS